MFGPASPRAAISTPPSSNAGAATSRRPRTSWTSAASRGTRSRRRATRGPSSSRPPRMPTSSWWASAGSTRSSGSCSGPSARRSSSAPSATCSSCTEPDDVPQPRSARSALRMTAMSIPSCSSAPATGGRWPNAATTMATTLRDMPATTLWRAIDIVRLPIRTASATRSIRSTVMTASAVSLDTVRLVPASAMPTSASASAGASLTPSPTMTTGRRSGCARGAHDGELVLRRLLGVDAIEAGLARDGERDVAAVTRDHLHVAHALAVEGGDEVGGVGTEPVAHDEHAGEAIVDADVHERLSGRGVELFGRRGAVAGEAVRQQPRLAAHAHAAAVDHCLDPVPRSFARSGRLPQRQSAGDRIVDEPFGQDVGGELVDRGGQAQQLRLADAVEADDPLDRGTAPRQGPRLVEQHGPRPRQLLEGAAALEDDPAGGRA